MFSGLQKTEKFLLAVNSSNSETQVLCLTVPRLLSGCGVRPKLQLDWFEPSLKSKSAGVDNFFWCVVGRATLHGGMVRWSRD